MDATLKRAEELKQALVDWVYDAEGELAVALEAYAADRASKERYDIKHQNLIVDTFLSEGTVGDRTPIALFLEQEPGLTPGDRALLEKWQRSFTGLFEVIEVLPQSFELMNWLSAKHYQVFPNDDIPADELKRLQPGEIILARIMPVTERAWLVSGPCILKGKLGKPKLAVAIGEFKQNYKDQLYGDAPELFQQAWESVAQFHQEFVEYFGSDRVTLPGYELNQKVGQLQEKMNQERLAAAGIDSSKSLKEVAQEAGVDEEELTNAVVEESGAESTLASKAVESALNAPMVTPKVDLPPEIRNAEQVSAFSHPRWGQIFVPTYTLFVAMLEAEEPQNQPNAEALVRKYLKDQDINYFIWQQLAQQYSAQLEAVLKTVLNRPEFNLKQDLEGILREYNKFPEPELPETASVPLHLHNLFQDAVAQVNKPKSKGKKKKKTKGFQ